MKFGKRLIAQNDSFKGVNIPSISLDLPEKIREETREKKLSPSLRMAKRTVDPPHHYAASAYPPTDVVLEVPTMSGTSQLLASKLVLHNFSMMMLLLSLIFFGITFRMAYQTMHPDPEREYKNLLLQFDTHFGRDIYDNTLHPSLTLYHDTVFIGHVNNDVDSVCSSIAAANLFQGVPALSGPINRETEFVLQRFQIPTPLLSTSSEFSNRDWCLVDHNSHDKIPRGVDTDRIVCVIDHHQLQEDAVSPSMPRWIQLEPIGSTTTILFWRFVQHNVRIPKHIAGCLISGIISDTLNLTSPTTTEIDRQAAFALLPLAGIDDMGTYAMEMFEAKSNVDDVSISILVRGDFKVYTLAGKKVGIAVVETVKPPSIWKRKQEIAAELSVLKQEAGLDLMLFMVTDILQLQTETLAMEEAEHDFIRHAYRGRLLGDDHPDLYSIGRLVSRKKQFVPMAEEYLRFRLRRSNDGL